jgi:uncharacterized protein (TIGR02271 family)
MYDTRQEAEAARQRLQSEFDVQTAEIYDQSSGESEGGSGFFGKHAISSDDRDAYSEGMKRGGFMLCAEVDSDEDADRIIPVLEQSSAVNFDQRQESWRNEGWSPQSSQSQSQSSGSFQSASSDFQSSGSSDTRETGERTVEEERIPIVREQLQVGKREVERGGARVRSYVRETPVSEQVNLREEHVEVERRPVNETLSQSDLSNRSDLLQDREIEMRATGEEAIIGKEARVEEELVIRKTAGEHTEQVQDTVRNTEVDVDDETTMSRESERSDRF